MALKSQIQLRQDTLMDLCNEELITASLQEKFNQASIFYSSFPKQTNIFVFISRWFDQITPKKHKAQYQTSPKVIICKLKVIAETIGIVPSTFSLVLCFVVFGLFRTIGVEVHKIWAVGLLSIRKQQASPRSQKLNKKIAPQIFVAMMKADQEFDEEEQAGMDDSEREVSSNSTSHATGIGRDDDGSCMTIAHTENKAAMLWKIVVILALVASSVFFCMKQTNKGLAIHLGIRVALSFTRT